MEAVSEPNCPTLCSATYWTHQRAQIVTVVQRKSSKHCADKCNIPWPTVLWCASALVVGLPPCTSLWSYCLKNEPGKLWILTSRLCSQINPTLGYSVSAWVKTQTKQSNLSGYHFRFGASDDSALSSHILSILLPFCSGLCHHGNFALLVEMTGGFMIFLPPLNHSSSPLCGDVPEIVWYFNHLINLFACHPFIQIRPRC